MQSHWGLGLRDMNWERGDTSIQSITVDENVEELGLSYLMGGDAKWGINLWFRLLAPWDEHMTPIRVLP